MIAALVALVLLDSEISAGFVTSRNWSIVGSLSSRYGPVNGRNCNGYNPVTDGR